MKDPYFFLDNIIESIGKIESFIKDVPKSIFLEDDLINSAVVRQIEIIGEAAKNLPDSLKRRNPNVPWKEISGTRDKMIHQYFGVDLDIVWNIVAKDLPKLKKDMHEIITKEKTQKTK